MEKKLKRRDFMRNTAVAGIALATVKTEVNGFPLILEQSTVKPLVIASANGNKFKHTGNVTAVQKAFQMITGGSDVLDAVIAGVNIVELDPLDDSVGYGGLPNGRKSDHPESSRNMITTLGRFPAIVAAAAVWRNWRRVKSICMDVRIISGP